MNNYYYSNYSRDHNSFLASPLVVNPDTSYLTTSLDSQFISPQFNLSSFNNPIQPSISPDSTIACQSTSNYNLALIPTMVLPQYQQFQPSPNSTSPPSILSPSLATLVPASSQSTSPPSSSPSPKGNSSPAPAYVHRDNDGVDWITFYYSKDRVQKQHTIRCDIESIDIRSLSTEFKKQNCIYPKACVPPEEYKGSRQKYEMECNCIGWFLAYINVSIRKRRGLIQRAVDSWRNTNVNPSLRSRRVRRLSRKQEKLKRANMAAAAMKSTATGHSEAISNVSKPRYQPYQQPLPNNSESLEVQLTVQPKQSPIEETRVQPILDIHNPGANYYEWFQTPMNPSFPNYSYSYVECQLPLMNAYYGNEIQFNQPDLAYPQFEPHKLQ